MCSHDGTQKAFCCTSVADLAEAQVQRSVMQDTSAVFDQVNSKYIAEDLIEDFDAGLEYAEADCIMDVEQKGDSLQFLIRCAILACAAVAAHWSSPVVICPRM